MASPKRPPAPPGLFPKRWPEAREENQEKRRHWEAFKEEILNLKLPEPSFGSVGRAQPGAFLPACSGPAELPQAVATGCKDSKIFFFSIKNQSRRSWGCFLGLLTPPGFPPAALKVSGAVGSSGLGFSKPSHVFLPPCLALGGPRRVDFTRFERNENRKRHSQPGSGSGFICLRNSVPSPSAVPSAELGCPGINALCCVFSPPVAGRALFAGWGKLEEDKKQQRVDLGDTQPPQDSPKIGAVAKGGAACCQDKHGPALAAS